MSQEQFDLMIQEQKRTNELLAALLASIQSIEKQSILLARDVLTK